MNFLIIFSDCLGLVQVNLPNWIPEEHWDFFAACTRRSDLSTRSIDIMSSYLTHDGGEPISDTVYAGASESINTFLPLLNRLAPNRFNGTFCTEYIDKFFVRRPVWFRPSADETEKARRCFVEYIMIVVDMCQEKTEDCEGFLAILRKLGTPLFSRITTDNLNVRFPARDTEEYSGVRDFVLNLPKTKLWYDEARELRKRLEVPTSARVADLWELVRLVGEDIDTIVLHVSDFLDHYGFASDSLEVWEYFFNIPHVDKILFRNAPRLRPVVEQGNRLLNYCPDCQTRGMISLVPGNIEVPWRLPEAQSSIQAVVRRMSRIYERTVYSVLKSRWEWQKSDPIVFIGSVTALLYSIKITWDPLADYAYRQLNGPL
jgi:hypothetical protein